MPATALQPRIRAATGRVLVHALLAGAAALGVARDAGAVFTTVGFADDYGLTLRVGSASAIDEIAFAVAGNNVGGGAVQGINSGTGTQALTVQVTPARPFFGLSPNWVTLTVDSSDGMTCQTAASCGGIIIPFTTVSWTSTNPASNGTDIQSGTFTGAGGQQIARYDPVVFLQGSRQMSNTLNFTYANTTVYPAGTYRGTVRFTATML